MRAPKGGITIFEVPGGAAISITAPRSINPQGEITGYFTEGVRNRGFVRDPRGGVTVFDLPGTNNTIPASINPQGEIVGLFTDGTGQHGFVRAAGGGITVFDVPGAIWFSSRPASTPRVRLPGPSGTVVRLVASCERPKVL